MKISICITVFNEEGSIGQMLDALFAQEIKPNEIIIVDGGSKDKTVDIIRHYQKKDKRIKLLVEKGNIAHGRNVSIDLAKGDVIALTDAGCMADEKWMGIITEPFKNKNAQIVAGYYVMRGESSLQKAVSCFHGVPPQRYNPGKFIPSARSVAFRKKVWEDVGGFREKLDRAGEDTLFCYTAVKRGYRIIREKNAIVYWEVPKTLKESLHKFFIYAKGDAQAGIWWNPTQSIASHNIKILSIFIRYLVGFSLLNLSFWSSSYLYLLIILTIGYLFWSITKWRDVVHDFKARLWLPIIQVGSDFAVMAGFITGLIKK